MKRKLTAVLLALLLFCLPVLGGCSAPDPEPESESEPEPSSSESSEEPEEEKIINPLTGEAGFSEEAVGKRPIAIMVSNVKQSLPQWGVSEADIIYEAVIEGGCTRLMCMFADIDKVPKIGPNRSVREYFPQFSEPFHAIFAHIGGSGTGNSTIRNNGINNLDGTALAGITYFKDPERYATGIGQENTFYTDAELLKAAIEKKGYEMEYDCPQAFNFVKEGEKASVSEELKADKISVYFSGYNKNAFFEYDAATGKYLKSQYDEPHIDANKAEDNQLKVDNVFVIYAPTSMIDEIHVRYYLESGTGYYFSEGKGTELSWTKGSIGDMFRFTDKDGEELKVNPGKTYICVVPKSVEGTLVLTTAQA